MYTLVFLLLKVYASSGRSISYLGFFFVVILRNLYNSLQQQRKTVLKKKNIKKTFNLWRWILYSQTHKKCHENNKKVKYFRNCYFYYMNNWGISRCNSVSWFFARRLLHCLHLCAVEAGPVQSSIATIYCIPVKMDAINVRSHHRPRDRGCHFRFRSTAFLSTAMTGQDPPPTPGML